MRTGVGNEPALPDAQHFCGETENVNHGSDYNILPVLICIFPPIVCADQAGNPGEKHDPITGRPQR